MVVITFTSNNSKLPIRYGKSVILIPVRIR